MAKSSKKVNLDSPLVHMTVNDLNHAIRYQVEGVIKEYIAPPTPLKVFTLSQAANELKVHRHTLRGYSDRGIIDSFRVGNRRMFTLEALEKFIRNKGSKQPTQQRTVKSPSINKG